MQKLLIVGSGDIARRMMPQLLAFYRVFVLVRQRGHLASWRALGAQPVLADLDDLASLRRLAGLADLVVHLAPPPSEGARDTRTRHLLAALGRGAVLPKRLVYISTTGVYGDCQGAWVDETRPPRPASARARRRVDAEQSLRAWGGRCGVSVVILRAPGIYAADRLPLARLQQRVPALLPEEDVWTNHIHADDLARAAILALHRAGSGRVIQVVDDSELQMAAYFDLVADGFALPRPPRLSAEVLKRQVSPMQWSFMCESRRLSNQRMKAELGLRLRFPTVDAGLAAAGAASAFGERKD